MINQIKAKIFLICLLLVFILSFFIRFYRLSDFPVGFHIDEAILGYTGYSLLLTGKDTNNTTSLYTEVFGDFIPIGYHYFTIIPILLFGLTEFSTRFPGAFFGALTTLVVFLLSQALFQNKKISLIGALFFAISPWHISLSRGSAETAVSLFFIVAGFTAILQSFRKENKLLLYLGTILLCASYFFYHTARLFIPSFYLVVIFVFSFFWKFRQHAYKIAILRSFLLCASVSFLLIFVIPGGSSRFNQVSIFTHPETKLVMEEQIREDGIKHTDVLLTRVFHNKIVDYSRTFFSNYSEYFTVNFLFLKGGLPLLFNVPQMGLVYMVELFFIVLGVFLLAKSKNLFYKIPLLWLFIAPVTSALTMDDIPNIRRAIIMVPAIEIIAAYGIFSFISYSFFKKTKKLIIFVLGILFLFNFSYFLHQYFIHTEVHRTWYRNNGAKAMINTIKKAYDQYEKVIVTKSTGGIYPLILFYMKMDPRIYQEAGSPKDREYTGFAKFFFVSQSCPSTDKDNRFPKGRFIYVDNGTCPDNKDLNNRKKAFINREDGTRAFRIVYD